MKKIMLLVAAILGIALLQVATAQSTIDKFSYNACMVPFNQPNIHTVNGLNPLDYHGSGSLDGLTISQYDVDMSKDGTYRYQLDVNGNTIADDEDTKLLQDYVDGKIDYLPGHWNKLNGIEKRFWVDQYFKQSNTRDLRRTLASLCGNYSFQEMLNTFGLEKPELMNTNDYDFSQNGRWNIPMYQVFTKVTLGSNPNITINNDGHWIVAVLVGPNTTERFAENPLKFSHWQFNEPQLANQIVVPGDFSMRIDAPVTIYWWGNCESNKAPWFADVHLVKFDLAVNSEDAVNKSEFLVLENPNKPVIDTGAPVLTIPENVTVEYGTDVSPSITGQATATDNIDPNPKVTYSDVSGQTQEGEGRFNYTITRTWTAKDASGNSKSGTQTITVQQTKGPEFTGEQSISLETGSDTSPESLPQITVTDNGEVVSLTYEDTSTQVMDGSINQANYTITRTWTAINGVGIAATFVQTITLTDTTAPTFDWLGNVTVAEGELETEAAKAPTNLADNSGVAPVVELSHYVVVYDGGAVATVSLTVTDAAGNKVSKMRIIKGGNPIIPDSAKPHLLEIYRYKDELQLKYFADAKEKVDVEVFNSGSGALVKTLSFEVVAGDNLIITPLTLTSSDIIVRVIDANTTNVQVESFLDF